MSVNTTFAGLTKNCPTHTDHPYPHHQLIVYLNACDSESSTVVLSEDKSKIVNSIQPKKYRGFCFSSAPHYMVFPRRGSRVVAVFTFA